MTVSSGAGGASCHGAAANPASLRAPWLDRQRLSAARVLNGQVTQ